MSLSDCDRVHKHLVRGSPASYLLLLNELLEKTLSYCVYRLRARFLPLVPGCANEG